MGIQVLPAPTSLGAEVGGALGQGIQRGAEQGFQRGQVQQALGQLGNLPPNATPFDLAKSLISATAGIPGAERYVGQLFPLLLQQLRGQQTGLTGPGAAGQEGAGVTGAGGQFPRTGGYLTPPMNAEELLAFAQRYALGDPSKIPEGMQVGQAQQVAAHEALADIETRARKAGVKESEIPYFMQMAQGNPEKNPQKLLTGTMRDLEQLRSLDNALIPGVGTGMAAKGSFGLIPALLSAPGRNRDKALKGMQVPIDALVEKGFEPIVRKKLADLGLSPTEIEERIHPFTQELTQKIDSFPKASSNAAKNVDILTNFFRKNISEGVPLLPIRHKLWKEKGYNWEQERDALRNAVKDGLKLNKSQETELTEFSSQPPRESLIDIFKDWDRFWDYVAGRK